MIGSRIDRAGAGARTRRHGLFRAARAATTLVGAALSLTLMAASAHADSVYYGDSYGITSASGECRASQLTGALTVTTQEPAAYKTSGLYFYTDVWYRAHGASSWTFLKRVGPTALIKTWSTWQDPISGGSGWQNNPTTIASYSFKGSTNANWDFIAGVYFAPPGAARWSAPVWVNVSFANYDMWGQSLTGSSTSCYFSQY